jgi:hypothetical protein
MNRDVTFHRSTAVFVVLQHGHVAGRKTADHTMQQAQSNCNQAAACATIWVLHGMQQNSMHGFHATRASPQHVAAVQTERTQPLISITVLHAQPFVIACAAFPCKVAADVAQDNKQRLAQLMRPCTTHAQAPCRCQSSSSYDTA